MGTLTSRARMNSDSWSMWHDLVLFDDRTAEIILIKNTCSSRKANPLLVLINMGIIKDRVMREYNFLQSKASTV